MADRENQTYSTESSKTLDLFGAICKAAEYKKPCLMTELPAEDFPENPIWHWIIRNVHVTAYYIAWEEAYIGTKADLASIKEYPSEFRDYLYRKGTDEYNRIIGYARWEVEPLDSKNPEHLRFFVSEL